MGTPAYMAPEQFNGLATDARTDQFAFCVAVWEGLFGLRPYSGSGITELMVEVSSGEVRDPPASAVPPLIERMLRRGLRPEPDDRWPDMNALLDTLEQALAPRPRRSWIPIAVGSLAIVGAGAVLSAPKEELCTGAEATLTTIWNDARAQRISDRASNDVRGATAWSTQRERLDGYAATWISTHREACEATSVRGEQSDAVLDLRMACLQRATLSLDETLGVFEDGPPLPADRLAAMVSALPSLERCSDVSALSQGERGPTPEIEDAVAEVRRSTERASALHRAGRFDEAHDTGNVALNRAREVGYAPAIADAALALGAAKVGLSQLEDAQPLLLEAQRTAVEQGMWATATRATARYVHLVGHRLSRPDEALAAAEVGWAFAARANDPWSEFTFRGAVTAALTSAERFDDAIEAIEETLTMYDRYPDLDPSGRARELDNLATVLSEKGELDSAVDARSRALAIQREVSGERHPDVARQLSNLGALYSMMGRNTEAEDAYRGALSIQQDALPPDHLDTTFTRANLAAIYASRGENLEAEPLFRDVVRGLEASLGATHPNTLMMRYGHAGVLSSMGQLEEAENLARAALADAREALGPKNIRVAGAAAALGGILLDRKKHDEAEAVFRTALEIHTEARGGAHPYTLSARMGLAETLAALGRTDEAESALRVGLEHALGSENADSLQVARLRTSLAEILLEDGQPATARELLERALPGLVEDSPSFRAQATLALARATWANPKQRERAQSLADEARTTLQAAPSPDPELAAEIAAWIEAHEVG